MLTVSPIADSLLERWREDLKSFRRDYSHLLRSRQIYRHYRDIVAANPAIQEPWAFHDWVIRNYAIDTVLAGCRLTDPQADAVSLRRLLERIKSNRHVITRELYLGHFADSDLDVDRLLNLPDRQFDRLAGVGAAALEAGIVQKDIDQLAAAWQPFKALRDQHLAHRDRRAVHELPSYDELDAAIEAIQPILRRYEQLLLGVASSAEPVVQFDWDLVFRAPWIQHPH